MTSPLRKRNAVDLCGGPLAILSVVLRRRWKSHMRSSWRLYRLIFVLNAFCRTVCKSVVVVFVVVVVVVVVVVFIVFVVVVVVVLFVRNL